MFLCAIILVGIDQIIKVIALKYLEPIVSYPLWDGVFHFTYVENTGAAFGIFKGMPFILIGLTSVIILVLIGILLSKKELSKFLMFSLSLIIAGGIGNLIDRIFRGFVIDYLHFKLIDFAVFNFADCCVVIGTILLLAYFVFFDKDILGEKTKKTNIGE